MFELIIILNLCVMSVEEPSRHYLPSPWESPELAQSLDSQPGVGKARANALTARGLYSLGDALWWLPASYENRNLKYKLEDSLAGSFVLIKLALLNSRAWGPGGRSWRMEFSDTCGNKMAAVWFRFNRPYLRVFESGRSYLLAGQMVRDKNNTLMMVHPKIYQEDDCSSAGVGQIWPLYPEIEGFAQGALRKIISTIAAQLAPVAPDFIYGLLPGELYPLPLGQALQALHNPQTEKATLFEQARQSLIVDELFYFELALSLKRSGREKKSATSLKPRQDVLDAFSRQLPFKLTAGQNAALNAIGRDLARSQPMARLLCGDVGSGKTLVAMGAITMAVAAGAQAALMAPTEILARQHYGNAVNILKNLDISLLLGGGKSMGPQNAQLVIGTQALLWQKEMFNNLGLVIVDEQHRFGVDQRWRLTRQGPEPHLLVMSATPIPRTLSLALSGYLDISDLPEHPNPERRLSTFMTSYEERAGAFQALKECISKGQQAYVVCALLDASDKLNAWDATTTYQRFCRTFPDLKIGLLHGQMKSSEQQEILDAFTAGQIKILVSTTVVEVGIDVANATMMLVLSAERFGLSQLHQLRGRVGRGREPGQCWLVPGSEAGEQAWARLQTLCNSHNGLEIAEADLGLRGPGETLGYKQSGLPAFRIANWIRDAEIIPALRAVIKNLDWNSADLQAVKQEARRRYGKRLGLIQIG